MISILQFLANWASGRIHFWRRSVIFASQKLKQIISVIVSGQMVSAQMGLGEEGILVFA